MPPEDKKKFYPDYLVEILLVMVVISLITLVLAMSFPKELGRRISFSAPFKPTPEWFFLWFFELLKYFPGHFAFIGAVALPVGVIVTLMTIPFIDKGTRGRIKAATAIGLIYLAFVLFTIVPAFDY